MTQGASRTDHKVPGMLRGREGRSKYLNRGLWREKGRFGLLEISQLVGIATDCIVCRPIAFEYGPLR